MIELYYEIFSITFIEIFIDKDKTTDLENYSYRGGFVVILAILEPAV